MPVKYFLIERQVKKKFSKFPLHVHIKINKAFDNLRLNPTVGIKLKGNLQHVYKYRIGDYRIMYEFEAKTKTLIIVKIEHRQGVYK